MIDLITFLFLICSVLSTFVTAMVFQVDLATTSSFSPDKLVKLVAMSLALLIVMLRFKQARISKDGLIFVFCISVACLTFFVHVALAPDNAPNIDNATKEMARVFGLAFLAISMLFLQANGLLLIRGLIATIAVACLVAIFSLHHSLTGEAQNTGRYVGDFVRAGSDLVDSNMLGAFFSLASIFSIVMFLYEKSIAAKLFYLLSLIVLQISRALTFSTGSLVNFLVGIFILYGFLRSVNSRMSKKMLLWCTFLIVIAVVYLWSSGLYEVIFYRVLMKDDYVAQASVYSRLAQYVGYYESIRRDPLALFLGFGAADIGDVTGTGFDVHNAILRSLAVGGVAYFFAFILLNYLIISRIYRSIKRPTQREIKMAACAIVAAYGGWFVQSLTLPADTTVNQWYFFIIGGVFLSLAQQLKSDQRL